MRSHKAPCPWFPKRCPFSCRRNSPQVMSGLRSWTGKKFHKRGPAAAKVLSPQLLYVRDTTQDQASADQSAPSTVRHELLLVVLGELKTARFWLQSFCHLALALCTDYRQTTHCNNNRTLQCHDRLKQKEKLKRLKTYIREDNQNRNCTNLRPIE